MGFDLRDWLLILGPIFIVGVLAHGYWRMRRGRGQLKMALDKSFVSKTNDEKSSDDLSMFKAELPNGGARVMPEPEQASLNLEEDVPVLMEPVDLNEKIDEPPRTVLSSTRGSTSEASDAESSLEEKAPPARDVGEKPEKFVVINVLADEMFNGQALLEKLVELGMTFGEMDIFHHLDNTGFSEYSLANAVEPGTFNPASMDEMQTPGVSLFMRAHELMDPVSTYDSMVQTAQAIAEELGGELRDETRSVMTSQTIGYCRQSIQDFQYKHFA